MDTISKLRQELAQARQDWESDLMVQEYEDGMAVSENRAELEVFGEPVGRLETLLFRLYHSLSPLAMCS